MTIKIGDKIPSATIGKMTAQGPAQFDSSEYFAGAKVALFAVPGAFTPTCSKAHLPGYVVLSDKLRAAGVDKIACISVNDAFVMHAWGQSANAEGVVDMLADGNGDFTAAIGLPMDARGGGMGQRSQRYSILVDDGVVVQLNVEAPKEFKISSAEAMLEQLIKK